MAGSVALLEGSIPNPAVRTAVKTAVVLGTACAQSQVCQNQLINPYLRLALKTDLTVLRTLDKVRRSPPTLLPEKRGPHLPPEPPKFDSDLAMAVGSSLVLGNLLLRTLSLYC